MVMVVMAVANDNRESVGRRTGIKREGWHIYLPSVRNVRRTQHEQLDHKGPDHPADDLDEWKRQLHVQKQLHCLDVSPGKRRLRAVRQVGRVDEKGQAIRWVHHPSEGQEKETHRKSVMLFTSKSASFIPATPLSPNCTGTPVLPVL